MDGEVGSGRLAELTIALSLATDLGTGQPLEHGLRTCRLAVAAASELGLDRSARACVYYTALLRFIGCTSDASETAALAGGDDIALNATMGPLLTAGRAEGTRHFVRHLAEDLPAHRRAGRIARALLDPGFERRSLTGHCEVGARLAGRLGLDASVCEALGHAYERWDGSGLPDGLAGADVPGAVRIVTVARDAELWARTSGWQAAAETLAARRGHGHDPDVVDVFLEQGLAWLAETGEDEWLGVLDAEPAPALVVDDTRLDDALAAVADFADLKSWFLRGHSPGVARLAATAADAAGLPPSEATAVGRAGLVHDVGRVGVPSGIWDHPGPLTTQQWERVRLHSYLGERVLARAALLSPFVELAGRHHERADGSGYHRGLTADRLPLAARLLAAADAFHAMTERRPHRPALAAADAAERLLAEVEAGRFRRAEVDAVLVAAGETRGAARASNPAGLTDREVEVLRLIARGHGNKQVAVLLGISPKTVGRHVEQVYAKAEVRTRAGAALFAMEQGLLAD